MWKSVKASSFSELKPVKPSFPMRSTNEESGEEGVIAGESEAVDFAGACDGAGFGDDFRFEVRAFTLEVGESEPGEVAQRHLVVVVVVAMAVGAIAVAVFHLKLHTAGHGGGSDAAMTVQGLQLILSGEQTAAGKEQQGCEEKGAKAHGWLSFFCSASSRMPEMRSLTSFSIVRGAKP